MRHFALTSTNSRSTASPHLQPPRGSAPSERRAQLRGPPRLVRCRRVRFPAWSRFCSVLSLPCSQRRRPTGHRRSACGNAPEPRPPRRWKPNRPHVLAGAGLRSSARSTQGNMKNSTVICIYSLGLLQSISKSYRLKKKNCEKDVHIDFDDTLMRAEKKIANL